MIRVATVIGHGIELLPHFLEHYNFADEIHIIVYVSDVNPNIESEIREIIRSKKKALIAQIYKGRSFDWEQVTKLYNEVKSKHPDDWWIIADIDEFHLYSGTSIFPFELIGECEKNGWDLVRGGFVDRIGIGGTFPNLEPNINIFEQFPFAGFFRYPMSQACPNKVCMMKGYVKITPGQHYAEFDTHTTWRWQGWNHPLIAPYEKYSIQVHHFKWDATSIQRLQNVADIKQVYAFSDEYRKMYLALKKNNFKVNIKEPKYMFEYCPKGLYHEYSQWNKLIRKIVAI